MLARFKSIFSGLVDIDRYERLKLLLLSSSFFLVIVAYTVARELKNSIFISIVGREYLPAAKALSVIVLIVPILIYAKLVDKMRRNHLLSFCCSLYGGIGLIFVYFMGHSTIGIANTDTDPYRLFGWLFYYFVEGYSPFVVSVFWAFANSVNSPESAKKSYGIMVSGSKLGGIFGAGLAWALLSIGSSPTGLGLTDVANHQLILAVPSIMLLIVPFLVMLLMKKVPGRYLHGYEAVYQVEKQKQREGKPKTGVFEGLWLLMRYPYVLGIFGIVFFYEVVITVLGYVQLGVAQENASSISDVSVYLFQVIFMVHFVGFFISFFGTGALLQKFGEKRSLMLIPVVSGILLAYFMFSNSSAAALAIAIVVLKSVNYAVGWPVRESLYIPTVKAIKFKSKSWIDSFGSKFGKFGGYWFSFFVETFGKSYALSIYSFFFAGIIGLWFITARLLGRRFEWAVDHDEVIGTEKETV